MIYRGTNVGLWKRTVAPGRISVQTRFATSLDLPARDAVARAGKRLAILLDLPLHYTDGSGRPRPGVAAGSPARAE